MITCLCWIAVIVGVAGFALCSASVIALQWKLFRERGAEDKLRKDHEAEMERLWKGHQAETDKDKRKLLREEIRDISGVRKHLRDEMRDINGNFAQLASRACRQGVVAAMMGTMLATATWIACGADFEAKPCVSWVLASLMFLSYIGAVLITVTSEEE